MSIDSQGDELNGLPMDLGEISDDDLRQLNDLLDSGPGEGASEEEVKAFMKKILGMEAGVQMVRGLAEQLTEGGSLANILDDEEEDRVEKPEYRPLESKGRLIVRVDLVGAKPSVWRRFSLPADASFFDLHFAIQDAFGWEDRCLHRFELRENGQIELIVSTGKEADYCEIRHQVITVAQDAWSDFRYLYQSESLPEHFIRIENIVQAGEVDTSEELTPVLHEGEGTAGGGGAFSPEKVVFRDPAIAFS